MSRRWAPSTAVEPGVGACASCSGRGSRPPSSPRRRRGHRGALAPRLLRARARQSCRSRGAQQRLRQLRLPRPERRLVSRASAAWIERTSRSCAASPMLRTAQPRARAALSGDNSSRAAAGRSRAFDVDLVPVAIFWGRAPHKEDSLWRLLFTEDWVLVGPLPQAAQRAVQRPQHRGAISASRIGLREAIGGLPPPRGVRRLMRALRAELRAQRASTIGPDLSHRRTMVAHVLRTRAVRRAVRREMHRLAQGAAIDAARRAPVALRTARRYAMEIAANYSQPFVTFMASVLGRLVEPPVRRRRVRARREAAGDRRRRRDHLRSVPSQPHGLSAAFLRDLSQGLRGSAHRRRRESQHAA